MTNTTAKTLILSALPLFLLPFNAEAQIAEDGTTSTTVTPTTEGVQIDNGDRSGGNLFHSFQKFSVPTNTEAYFNNANDVANIFSRVTGSEISNIDGLIRANGTANLFLMNPNGIIFGENASLNIGGSFFATTADSILFEDNVAFSASDPTTPLLTSSIPIGANFRDNPADIVNRAGFIEVENGDPIEDAGLEVNRGEAITLVGGDINLENGRLTARGGRIELGGLAEAGIIEFDEDLRLNFSEELTRADVSLTGLAEIDVTSGERGDISISANNINILDGSDICAGIGADSACGERNNDFGSVAARAGDITFNAIETIIVDGEISDVNNNVNLNSVGNGGNINIQTGSLFVTNGGRINTNSFGEGNGGKITINASESVSLGNEESSGSLFSTVGLNAFGDSGGIEINTSSLIVSNSQIDSRTSGTGKAGNVDIEAQNITFANSTIFTEVSSDGGTGDAGDINITTNSLSLQDGSAFLADTENVGNAGDISIEARDRVVLEGEGRSQITATVEEAIGNAGNIQINTDLLSISDGGFLNTSTSGEGNAGNININAQGSVTFDGRVGQDNFPSAAFTSVEFGGEGNGGNLNIKAESLEITDRAQLLSNVEGTGDAGDINIQVKNEVNLVNSSIISEVTEPSENGEGGRGEGGNINITTGSLLLQDGSALLADTENIGDAGDINIRASERVVLEGEGLGAFPNDTTIVPSQITVTVESEAVGEGGDINLSTGSLVVTDGGFIRTSSFGKGDAGKLDIDTGRLLVSEGAFISTEARRNSSGKGGNLTVNATELIELTGTSANEQFSSALSSATGGTGDAGELTITTPQLRIKDGAAVVTSTFNQGRAGNLTVNATNFIELSGSSTNGEFFSRLTSETFGSGDAGKLDIDTQNLFVTDGAFISSATRNVGNAGEITVNVTEAVKLTGTGGLFVTATSGSTAGSLILETGELTIADGAFVSVSSPQGQAGNLNLTVDSLSQNQGRITAVTGVNQADIGANINLEISDLWRLENESLVSATAFGDADGGNININQGLTDTDLILVAFPPTGPNGSDIIANAEQGTGGRIELNAAGVFGIEFREELTRFNDFTVSSEFGQQGETIINRTVDDPTGGLIELPQAVGDPSDQISQNPCEQGVGSEFVVTGKGGFPANPQNNFSSDPVRVGLVEPVLTENQAISVEESNTSPTEERDVVPAQGWVFNEEGQVVLTAYDPTQEGVQRNQDPLTGCPVPKAQR